MSGPIAVGGRPTDVTTGFGYAWVALAGGRVRRIDPTELRPTGSSIRAGRSATAIAAGNGYVWTLDRHDSTVTRIRPQAR